MAPGLKKIQRENCRIFIFSTVISDWHFACKTSNDHYDRFN
jgi:hypothetical protein